MSRPTVRLVGWHYRSALLVVDGVKVRIKRTGDGARWVCGACGERTGVGHCEHTRAAAQAPADPAKRVGAAT